MKIIFFVIIILELSNNIIFCGELERLTKNLMPAVVTIYTESGLGSGFIVDKNGYIITNAHVVSKLWDDIDDIDDPLNIPKERVTVLVENKYQYPAEVIGYNPRVDIAVLKINTNNKKLKILKLGDSNKIKLGEKIIVLGSPLGLEETATVGVISHVGRPLSAGPGWEFQINVIQTDAAINPGNSGGPMVNIKGEVIGVNYATTAKWSSEGIGFAIPINIVKYIKDKIISSKKVQFSYLGIDLYPVTKEFSDAFNIDKGILVETVYKNSPAEIAGIKPGDIIITFNNKTVSAVDEREVNDFQWKIATLPVGEKVNIEVLRYNENGSKPNKILYNINLVESPLTEIELKPYFYEDLGLVLKDITEPVYLKYSLSVHEGLWISKILGGSAYESELRVGDVISKVDENPIKTNKDFKNNIISVLKNKKKYIPLTVLRNKDVLPIFLKINYPLEKKNVVLIILSEKLPSKLNDILNMKFLFNGVNMTYVGLDNKKIKVIDGKMETDIIIPEITIDNLLLNLNKYDAFVFIGDKYSEEYNIREDKVSKLFKDIIKNDKIIAVTGEYVVKLIECIPELKNRKIACASEYVSELKKYDILITGNEVEVDNKIITSTNSEESYSQFAYQLIKTLRD
jgi:serine protease Do